MHHGSDEIGQGSNTVLAQIAAEEFNMPIEQIKVVWGDTSAVPFDHGAISSRTTLFAGNAVRLACQDAKRQLFELAAPRLGLSSKDLEIGHGKVYRKGEPDTAIEFCDLFLSEAKGGQREAMSRCLAEGAVILGRGTFLFNNVSSENPETGQGEKLTASYCYTAQAVEVAVDIETGVVKILQFYGAADAGQPINPKLCEGQIEGGAAMGIGSTLFEEIVLDNGKVVTTNFNEYKMPSAAEIPDGDNFKSAIISAPNMHGPFGAKGIGEGLMTPTAPAIANAIYNAIGIRIMDLPITPEKILTALKKVKK